MRAFAASAGLLLLLILWAWLPSRPPPALPAPRPVHAAAGARTADADEVDYDELAETVLARPLFTIGRRPVKIAETSGHSAGTGMPRLSGIMITPTGRLAIFMPDGGKPQEVAVGATVGQHVVREIDADGVLLEGVARKLRPTLDRQRAGGLPTNPINPGFQPQPFQPQPFQPQQFQPQPFQPQNFQPPPPQQATDEAGDAAPNPPPQGVPIPMPFRPVVPRGRE